MWLEAVREIGSFFSVNIEDKKEGLMLTIIFRVTIEDKKESLLFRICDVVILTRGQWRQCEGHLCCCPSRALASKHPGVSQGGDKMDWKIKVVLWEKES